MVSRTWRHEGPQSFRNSDPFFGLVELHQNAHHACRRAHGGVQHVDIRRLFVGNGRKHVVSSHGLSEVLTFL